MLQEDAKCYKSTKLSDIVLMIIIVLVIIFMRRIFDAFSFLPYPAVFRTLTLLALVYFCYLIYSKRIISYRYSLIVKHETGEDALDDPAMETIDTDVSCDSCLESEAHELNEYGDPTVVDKADLPPIGTVCFERMVGDKTKVAEAIAPEDMLLLLAPKENVPEDMKPVRRVRMTVLPKSSAHSLIYMNGGRRELIYFHPSDEFISKLKATMQK